MIHISKIPMYSNIKKIILTNGQYNVSLEVKVKKKTCHIQILNIHTKKCSIDVSKGVKV